MSSNDNPQPKGSEQSKQEQPESPPFISPVGQIEAPPASAQSTPKGEGKQKKDDSDSSLAYVILALVLGLIGAAAAYKVLTAKRKMEQDERADQPTATN